MSVDQRIYSRSLKLEQLGFDSYRAYIDSPLWKRTRARYWNSDRIKVCICGEADHLALHHLTYERVGAESLDDLTPLCPECHALIHTLEARGDVGLDFAGLVSQARAAQHHRNTPVEGDSWDDCHRVRLQRRKFMRQVADGVNRLCELLPPDEARAELEYVREFAVQKTIERATYGGSSGTLHLPEAPPMGHYRHGGKRARLGSSR